MNHHDHGARAVHSHPRHRRTLRRAGGVLGGLVIALLAAVVAGAFLPGVPGINIIGAALSGNATLLLGLSAIGLALAVSAVRRHRSVLRMLAVATLAATMVGSAVLSARILGAAARDGVDVPFLGLGTTGVAHDDPDANEAYTLSDGTRIEVSVWKPGNGDTSAPVMLDVHGGGWIGGDRLGNANHRRWFADHGWLVMSANYTLSSATEHHWDVSERQVGCAMVWANQNAGRFGGDPTRFVMTGDSAGGNLAVNASYAANAGKLQPLCQGDLPTVDALAVLYPVVDPVSFHDNPDLFLGGPSRTMTEQYTGGTPQQFPERYARITSFDKVTPGAPPTVVLVGSNDTLVPPQGSPRLVEALETAGVDARLVTVPYGQHGFDLASPVGAATFRQVAQDWLSKHVS